MSGRAEYLRPGEASQLLGIGRTTFWRLRQRDDFPRPRQFAGADRFRREELLAWAEERSVEPSKA